MKKNEVIEFNSLVIQKQQQNELAREVYQEEANMYLLSSINKTGIVRSEDGIKFARKLVNRINNFYKSIDRLERDTNFLLINIDATLDRFTIYLLSRVKGDEKTSYEAAFEQQSFKNDVKNLLMLKSFEHKQELKQRGVDAFFSAKAECASSIAMVIKSNRAVVHESLARLGKIALTQLDGSKGNLTPEQLTQITSIAQAMYEEQITKQITSVLGIESQSMQKLDS